MDLPIRPPFPPMEARLVDEIPVGREWQYEPKWDGFRCLAFRNGETVELQSKAGQSLTRYFPEVAGFLLSLPAKKFVLDGELAVPVAGCFSFDALLQRIHPAASRVAKLSKETKAIFIIFDLLVDDRGTALAELPLSERRVRLAKFAASFVREHSSIRLSPSTESLAKAKSWFQKIGNDLDGIIAKRRDYNYRSGDRTGMQKIKLVRTADCVVGGFRYATSGKTIGSLLLGLYNEKGKLDHVGFCSGLTTQMRKDLAPKLEKLEEPPGFTGNAPGGPSRWSTKRSSEWHPLKPKLVLEVTYDHFTGGRFRHGTALVRWRPDKTPRQCGIDQVAKTGRGPLALL
jgi:ATP-dependent DNA ligase